MRTLRLSATLIYLFTMQFITGYRYQMMRRLSSSSALSNQLLSDRMTEKKLCSLGYKYIIGVDEAGRGPLAGPVVAAAVCLPMMRFQLPDSTPACSNPCYFPEYSETLQQALANLDLLER